MNATTKLCKEGLLKLVALMDKLPVEADINRASSEWNGTADVLLRKGLDEVAAAYALEIKERRFEETHTIQRTTVLDEITLVQIVPDSEASHEKNKKIPHDCERSHTGYVLREHNKDMFILAQRNGFGKGVQG